jgi:hypothetical protein
VVEIRPRRGRARASTILDGPGLALPGATNPDAVQDEFCRTTSSAIISWLATTQPEVQLDNEAALDPSNAICGSDHD